MDRMSIGLEKAYLGWDVPAYCFNSEGKMLESFPEGAKKIPDELLEQMRRECRKNKYPTWFFADRLVYMLFESHEELVVLGPVFLYGISSGKVEQEVACLFPEKAASCLSTVCYLITGEYFSEQLLLRWKTERIRITEEEAVKKFLCFAEEDDDRYGYDAEQRWVGLISRGELEPQVTDMNRIYRELYRVGILTEQGEKKQVEYMMVSAITLASRAAIQGGVDPGRAYELSDLCLQKLSAAANIQEIALIGQESIDMFNDMVKEHLDNASGNMYCEQIKNYIGKHIREKIRITDIAQNVGLNSSYLTHLFSESEGMSIKSYIMEERLKLAANLLKNTNETVGRISDYLHFNSQSYFTSCFRKQYQMMPTEFRQRYKSFTNVAMKDDNKQ